LIGLDGWGDHSGKDGCFHRVRYTGGSVYKRSGFEVRSNGIRINFATKLDSKSWGYVSRYFARCWNYEYAKRYGSPEFLAKHRRELGHDPVAVRSVTLLEENDSIFIEMPDMGPVMQLHLRMHLVAADGHAFKTDLFVSPMFQGDYFAGDGLEPPREGIPTAIAHRVAKPEEESSGNTESGKVTEGARELVADAIGGLQYAQNELTAKPVEAISLKLGNTDVMPHNLVIVSPGAMQKVGAASFKMLNDPDAGKNTTSPMFPKCCILSRSSIIPRSTPWISVSWKNRATIPISAPFRATGWQ